MQRGAILARYDKHRLVPFGEFVPFNRWLPLDRLTDSQGAIDYTPGGGLVTLASASSVTSSGKTSLPSFSPLICFEVIFSGRVALGGEQRPEWLVNLTNDAWFGRTAGPYQHFAAARMRAVEEGLPLVRAANNGISGVIDGRGRVQSLLPLGARGVLDANLPRALPPPVFARYGLWIPAVALGASPRGSYLCEPLGAQPKVQKCIDSLTYIGGKHAPHNPIYKKPRINKCQLPEISCLGWHTIGIIAPFAVDEANANHTHLK